MVTSIKAKMIKRVVFSPSRGIFEFLTDFHFGAKAVSQEIAIFDTSHSVKCTALKSPLE